jgi:hypothetical protein
MFQFEMWGKEEVMEMEYKVQALKWDYWRMLVEWIA